MTSLLDQVRGLRAALVEGSADPGGRDVGSDATRVDLIAALEQLTSAACAVQGDLAVALDASVREQHARSEVPRRRRGRGVAEQVAAARQESSLIVAALLGASSGRLLSMNRPQPGASASGARRVHADSHSWHGAETSWPPAPARSTA